MKDKSTILVTLVLLLSFLVLPACSMNSGISNTSEVNHKNIAEIKMIDDKTGYGLDQSKVVITYDGGKNWVTVPKSEEMKDSYELTSIGFYITSQVTAIAYGGVDKNPVIVLISKDEGKTWSTSTLPDNQWMEPETYDQSGMKFLGFTNQNDGWIVTTGEVAMGAQNNFIYKTADGGKTWVLNGSTDKLYNRVVSGVGFANKEIGFIGFRYEDYHEPIVYITQDGGKTWNRQNIPLPLKYKEDFATPLSPTFAGAKGELPVSLSNGDKKDYITIRYTSTDYGIHWNLPAE